jgi:hypothetical protein
LERGIGREGFVAKARDTALHASYPTEVDGGMSFPILVERGISEKKKFA